MSVEIAFQTAIWWETNQKNNLAYVTRCVGLPLTDSIGFLRGGRLSPNLTTRRPAPKSRPEKSKSLNSEPENKFSVEIPFQTEIQSGGGDLIKEKEIALERKDSS